MRIGEKESSYHLRDWIFSRQHYWGEPIPMVNCPKCNWVPEKEENLPVVLPEVEAYEPTDTGESPLAKMTDWVKCKCPVCGGEAKRETDTMPNWAGSDWYYLRYIDPNNNSKLADFDLLKRWLPVDVYAGGDEHNTLHLLYSRFIHQFLNDLEVVPTREPYYRRLSHGVILGPDGARMSKSRGNVVVPGEIVAKFGVDVMRMYLMFMGPFEATMVWDEKTLMGVKRFLDRFEKTITNYQLRITNDSDKNIKLIINKLIDGVTRDLENFSFNTVIAKLMKALNQLSINNYELRIEEIKTLIKLIAPMAPYMAEELWSKLGEGSVHEAGWPIAEEKYLTEEEITIPVAVDGKMRDQLSIMNDQLRIKNKILARARELPKVKKWIEGKEVVKEIYVVGKMVNFVLK